MKQAWILVPVLTVGLWVAPRGWAAEPAAIVEQVTSATAGVGFMDYLEPGQIIQLRAGERLILGYLRSCWRETITGGRITVGVEKSSVEGGRVQRERVECDGGRLRLTVGQASKSGVVIFRKPSQASQPALPRPQLTVYSTSPLIRLSGGDRIVIERLDQPEEPIEIAVTGNHLDLADHNKFLKPGGIYRSRAGERSIVFKIDPFARPGKGPLISRLLPF